jgi:hypothetical protein
MLEIQYIIVMDIYNNVDLHIVQCTLLLNMLLIVGCILFEILIHR